MEANQELLAKRKQKGHLKWRDFRKVKFVRETRKELNELRQDLLSSNVALSAARDIRDDIIESAYSQNPYPEYCSDIGHGYLCTYEGVKDMFKLTKLYYKRQENGKRLTNALLEAWDFTVEIRAIPSMILALEELYAFIIEKLKKEGKSIDLRKAPMEPAPFMHDDVKTFAPTMF